MMTEEQPMKSSHKFNDTDAYIQEMLRTFKLIDIQQIMKKRFKKPLKTILVIKSFYSISFD